MLPKIWEVRRNCPGRLFDETLCSQTKCWKEEQKMKSGLSKTFVWESNRVPKPPKSAYKRVNQRSKDGFFGLSTVGLSTTARTHALERASKRPRMRILTCWFGLTESSFGSENATFFLATVVSFIVARKTIALKSRQDKSITTKASVLGRKTHDRVKKMTS